MSSDSSDDENLKLFQEAADKDFINDSMFKNIGKTPNKVENTTEVSKEPSLRSSKNEVYDLLDVTPEFQEFVAKKLSNILEKQINSNTGVQALRKKHKKRKEESGIKLFSESVGLVKDKVKEEHVVKNSNSQRVQKRRAVEDINFKEIAVNPDDIINQSEVKKWSKWSRSKVFRYKKLKDGILEYIEPDFNSKQKRLLR